MTQDKVLNKLAAKFRKQNPELTILGMSIVSRFDEVTGKVVYVGVEVRTTAIPNQPRLSPEGQFRGQDVKTRLGGPPLGCNTPTTALFEFSVPWKENEHGVIVLEKLDVLTFKMPGPYRSEAVTIKEPDLDIEGSGVHTDSSVS